MPVNDPDRAARRRVALEHHPDRGGDPAAFAAAMEALERPAPAPGVVFYRRPRRRDRLLRLLPAALLPAGLLPRTRRRVRRRSLPRRVR